MWSPRRIAVLLLLAGLGLLGASVAVSPAEAADPTYNASLKESHEGAMNPGFTEGDCPEPGFGWHFVIPAKFGNDAAFVAVEATFQNAGGITEFSSFPTAKHAYVYTPGPDTLLTAEAEVDNATEEPVIFNLSHVCTGDVGPTTGTTGTDTGTTGTDTGTTGTDTGTTGTDTGTTGTDTGTTGTDTGTTGTDTGTTGTTGTDTGTTGTDTTTPSTVEDTTVENTDGPGATTGTSGTTTPSPVQDAAVQNTAGTGAATTGASTTGGTLPRTGANSGSLFLAGLALALGGIVLFAFSRRARSVA